MKYGQTQARQLRLNSKTDNHCTYSAARLHARCAYMGMEFSGRQRKAALQSRVSPLRSILESHLGGVAGQDAGSIGANLHTCTQALVCVLPCSGLGVNRAKVDVARCWHAHVYPPGMRNNMTCLSETCKSSQQESSKSVAGIPLCTRP